jgi:ubiquitin C-terminal hydrolase
MEELSKDAAMSFRPREMKTLIGKYNDLFADHAQHDAGELMSTVLTHLSEELNTVVTRKTYKIDASVGRTDEQLLEEYIKKDRHRSHSLIEDLFFGRFLTVY